MVGSWTDWDLTELGKIQADYIGKKLSDELAGKKVVLYSSDLKRAIQTAEEIAKYLGVKPIFRQELRERNLGKCCGKSVQWLRENIECPENTVDDRLFSDGESRRDAWNRLKPFYDEIINSDEENIIIVSHGDLLSIWNAMYIGLPLESFYDVDIHGPAGGVSHMIIGEDGKHRVRHINSSYKKGKVRKSLEKDLEDFKRDYVDIYWLHLPSDIEENLLEITGLAKEGKIRHIGLSNFTLDECKKAKRILDDAGLPLYGVQNHYSLLNREWEKNGLVAWCHENGISFWAWAVLEEGILTDPKVRSKMSLMKLIFNRKKKKLTSLYELMNQVGEKHNLTIPQVAMSFCSSKGIIPICGCRKPYQVESLFEAVNEKLNDDEIKMLEEKSDELNVKILGADIFRFAVKNKHAPAH